MERSTPSSNGDMSTNRRVDLAEAMARLKTFPDEPETTSHPHGPDCCEMESPVEHEHLVEGGGRIVASVSTPPPYQRPMPAGYSIPGDHLQTGQRGLAYRTRAKMAWDRHVDQALAVAHG